MNRARYASMYSSLSDAYLLQMIADIETRSVLVGSCVLPVVPFELVLVIVVVVAFSTPEFDV